MSSQGGARQTKSASDFFQGAGDGKQRKRLRPNQGEEDMAAPTISITPAESVIAVDSNITVIERANQRSLNVHDVTKLERLVDKCDRYESHKGFLEQCIRDKIVPVGLQINLTPTIGNGDDDFVEKWHKRLEEFSLTIMGDIVEFCNKTLEATRAGVEEAKSKVEATATQEEQSMVMDSIKEDQRKRKETLRRGKQKKIHFLKYRRNLQGNSEQHRNQNNNLNHQSNEYSWQQQNDYRRNDTLQKRSNGQNHHGRRFNNHSEGDYWNDRPKDIQSRNNQQSEGNQWNNKESNDYQYRRNTTEEEHNRSRPNRGPISNDNSFSRKDSSTSLGRRRSSNRLLNSKNNNQPKLWSSLLQPKSNANNNSNQHGNDTEAMQQRINHLEEQLAKQNRNNEGNNESKNLQSTSRNGGGEMHNNPSTSRPTESQINQNGQVNPMELNDILQIISTTMATLKDFENRCKNAKST